MIIKRLPKTRLRVCCSATRATSGSSFNCSMIGSRSSTPANFKEDGLDRLATVEDRHPGDIAAGARDDAGELMQYTKLVPDLGDQASRRILFVGFLVH